MNINNIQLKPNLLADLYKDCLIDTNTKLPPEIQRLKYLGNNQKNILIIVSHATVPFLPDGELNFLTNILAACKLSIADIGIINDFQASPEALQKLIQSEGKNVLLFGVEPASIDLPINFPFYQLQKFAGKIYLSAPALEELERDKTAKQKLWISLKNLFEL